MKKLQLPIIFLLGYCLFLSQGKAQITIYPNFSNFESEGLCGTSCTGSCNPIGVWRNADQWGFAQAGTDWLSEDGPTPSTATGPDIDHTLGNASGKYMYVETSGCNLITAHLVSDVFDFSALAAPKIEFYYHMLGATMGTMHFDVDTTGLGNWVLDVATPWTDNVNTWQYKLINLSAFAGRPSVRLRFRGITGSSFTSDMAIDDVNVFEPAAYDYDAYRVSNPANGCGLGLENLCIEYINNGTNTLMAGDSLEFSYQINGGLFSSETHVLTSNVLPGDTASFCFTQTTDLSAPGAYTIRMVVHHLSDLILGNDTVQNIVSSIPLYSTFPVLEDFEGGQNGWVINNGTNGTWAFGTPAKTTINSAGSGVNSFVTGGLGTGFYNNLDNSYIQGACYDFTTVCDPTISLKVWWNAEFSWDGANITTSTDGGTTWQLQGAFADPTNWYTDNTIVGIPGGYQEGWSGRLSTGNGSNGWVRATHKLAGVAGYTDVLMRINFGTDGSVTDDGFAFDDVAVYDGVWLGLLGTDAFCVGDSTTLYPSNASGPLTTSYLWNTGATTSTISANTEQYYSVTYNYGACSNTDSIMVWEIDNVNNDFASLGPDITVCDSTVTLDAGGITHINWNWSTGSTTSTTTLNGEQSTIVYLSGISMLTGCPGTSYDTIAVDIVGENTVSIPDASACGQVSIDAGSGQAAYDWSNGDTTQIANFTGTGPVFVTVTDADGCTATDSADVIVNPNPVVDLGPDEAICFNDSTILDGGSLPLHTYLWSTGASTPTTSAVGSVLGTGSHVIGVIGTSSFGCVGVDTIVVTVNALPTVDLGSNLTICSNSTTILDAGSGFSSYLWSTSATTQTIIVDGSILGTGSHNFSVTVTDANTCENTDAITVNVIDCSGIDNENNFITNVYPNPATDLVWMQVNVPNEGEIKISLTNELGQVIYSETPKSVFAGEQILSLNVSSFAPGLYFIQVDINGKKMVSRIVVQ